MLCSSSFVEENENNVLSIALKVSTMNIQCTYNTKRRKYLCGLIFMVKFLGPLTRRHLKP